MSNNRMSNNKFVSYFLPTNFVRGVVSKLSLHRILPGLLELLTTLILRMPARAKFH